MDFNQRDIGVIVSMSLSVIIMSFAFPALGMTDESDTVAESDIPEFNLTTDRFDMVGDFPESPGTPQQGTLEWHENGTQGEGIDIAWIDRPKSDGTSIQVVNSSADGEMMIWFNEWSGGSQVGKDEYVIANNSEGTEIVHQNASWTIEFTIQEVENYMTGDMYVEVDYNLIASPAEDEGGVLSSIPVIGGLMSAGSELAAFVGHLVSIIFWAFGTVFEIALNLVAVLFDIVSYMFNTMWWLMNTFNSIVSAANSWAKPFLMVPLVIIFAEFAKLGMVAISLLPTT